MFGSVGAFFFKYLLGVRPLEPGYRKIAVRPAVLTHPNLTHAFGTVATPLGACDVSWATNTNLSATAAAAYSLKVAIPAGSTALVTVPLSVAAPHTAAARPVGAAVIQESGRRVWARRAQQHPFRVSVCAACTL